MRSCHTAGYPEAQIPILARSNKLWANCCTSPGLFPGEVKNVPAVQTEVQGCVKWQNEREHLPGPSVVSG